MAPTPQSISDLITQLSAQGDWRMGEILVRADGEIRHREDEGVPLDALTVYSRPEEVREIVKNEAEGKYRPLKTAPNLRRGWCIQMKSVNDLRLALDFIYPAALGTFLAGLRGELAPVPFRETLGRQTGMYRITQLIRDDQADELISSSCGPGCLRRTLWELAPGRPQPITEPPALVWPTREVPLLCLEVCNLVVAACRPIGKSNLPVVSKPSENPAQPSSTETSVSPG
jgi:sirohydrochlorin cobaltochelatase